MFLRWWVCTQKHQVIHRLYEIVYYFLSLKKYTFLLSLKRRRQKRNPIDLPRKQFHTSFVWISHPQWTAQVRTSNVKINHYYNGYNWRFTAILPNSQVGSGRWCVVAKRSRWHSVWFWINHFARRLSLTCFRFTRLCSGHRWSIEVHANLCAADCDRLNCESNAITLARKQVENGGENATSGTASQQGYDNHGNGLENQMNLCHRVIHFYAFYLCLLCSLQCTSSTGIS